MQAEEPATNRRSDVRAKQAFCVDLDKQGYDHVRVVGSPTDVTASRDGIAWLFEVKYTRESRLCFGAATLTEWAAATKDPDHFRFVIAYENDEVWRFDYYTPQEFMAFSSVPPFKIYFSVPLNDQAARKRALASRRIYLTTGRLALLSRQFEELRALEDQIEAMPDQTPRKNRAVRKYRGTVI